MTTHIHDTDCILAVLGEAIEKLRSNFGEYDDSDLDEIANDLALLHGAVEAEAKQAEEADDLSRRVWAAAFRHRMVQEKLQADVDRGDFRDDDWKVDG